MSIAIRHYFEKRMCDEFYDVIAFLKEYGAIGNNKNWHWGRWEWLLSHPSLNEATLPSIGVCMDNEEILGLVTHDMSDESYIVCNPKYSFAKPLMVDYANGELSRDGVSHIYVDKDDEELNRIVQAKRYLRTSESECVLEISCKEKWPYVLPNGFHLTDYHSEKNPMKYSAVIHRGFENDGEPEVHPPERRPHFNPNLALFAVAPNGDYAAHCGMWYRPCEEIAYVEPVATVPEYRNCGLGKAVVYECINRCAEMGAQKAIVISNQTFYHRIGFKEYAVNYLWEKGSK